MTPERVAKLRAVLNKRQNDLTIITDYVHKGRNLSAIIRTADAVGIMEVHCVIGDQDYKAFRGTAKGSHRWVKVNRHTTVTEPIARLKAANHQIVAAHFSDTALDFREVDFTRPTALLLGAEKSGVSDQGDQLADKHITIPMVGMTGSFNVSVAAGIILAEAQRQRQQAGLYDHCRIDEETYQTLLFEWGHPQIKRFCDANRLTYPNLREDGEIDNPSAWYANARQRLADRSN